MSRALFWACAALLAYSYALFPFFVLLRGRASPRRVGKADITPSVSLIIAAHNEAARIGAKLDSLERLDYPMELLELIVASDGSTDATAEVVKQRGRVGGLSNVQVLDLPRVGKAGALNAAVAQARGEILAFSDANAVLAPSSLRSLVRSFADPEVGGVAGNQVYVKGIASAGTATGEKSFWSIDRAMKDAQSRSGNAIAATGSLYAVRRDLFQPVAEGVTDDLFVSLSVIDAGRRLVFEPDAIAFEMTAKSSSIEYGRKVRIMTRGLRGLSLRPHLLNPRRTGFYALDLISRKLLMRLMAVPLLLLALTSAQLARSSRFFRLVLLMQATAYTLGGAGFILADRRLGRYRLLALPAYFCLVQVASVHATWNVLRKRTYDRWEPERGLGEAAR